MESANPGIFRTPLRRAKVELFPNQNGVRFYVKDESRNPFGTFKDRRNEELVRLNSGINPLFFVQISFGNSAFSLGRYAMAANKGGRIVEAFSIVPPELNPEVKKSLSECSRVVELDLSRREITFEEMQEKVREAVGHNVPEDHILGVESHNLPGGYRKIVREIEHQMRIRGEGAPDYLVCPVGEGELLTEIAQESELVFRGRPPKIIGGTIDNNIFVHPDGRDDGFVRIREIAGEVGDKLANGHSKFFDAVFELISRNRVELRVADPLGIADMYFKLKRLNIRAEPSAAVAFEVAREYAFPPGSSVVVISTGSGIYPKGVVYDIARNRNPPGMVRLKDDRLVRIPDVEDRSGDPVEMERKHPAYKIFRDRESVEKANETAASGSAIGTALNDEKGMLEHYVKFIDERGILRNGSTLVYCGCGSGEHLPWALENFDGVIGVDFSKPSLKAAAKRVAGEKPDDLHRLRLIEGDFSEMKWLPSESVDFALCTSNTIESDNFEMQKAAFSEMNRVLRHISADSASMLMFTFYINTEKGKAAQREFYEKLGFVLEESDHVEAGKHYAIFRNADGERIRSLRFSNSKEVEDLFGENFGILHVGDLRGTVGYVVALPKGDKKILGAELLKAVLDNKRSSISFLALAGADTEIRDALDNTPLCLCAERGQPGRTKDLMSFGANVNVENKDGDSPLILACLQKEAAKESDPSEKEAKEARYLTTVRYLLEKDADLFHFNDHGMNALSAALEGGNKQIFGAVAKRAVYLHKKEMEGLKNELTLIKEKKIAETIKDPGSIAEGRKRIIEKMEKHSRMFEEMENSKSPAMELLKSSEALLEDLLREKGEEVRVRKEMKRLDSKHLGIFQGKNGSKSPLMRALEKEDFDAADWLIRSEVTLGGNPFSQTDGDGNTPLRIAIRRSARCALFLLDKMEKVRNSEDSRDIGLYMDPYGAEDLLPLRTLPSLLNLAVEKKSEEGIELVRRLIKLGAKMESENGVGYSPLENAIRNKNIRAAKILVDAAKEKHEALLKQQAELRDAIACGDLKRAFSNKSAGLKPLQSLNSKLLFKAIAKVVEEEGEVEVRRSCLKNGHQLERNGQEKDAFLLVKSMWRELTEGDGWRGGLDSYNPAAPPKIIKKLIQLKVDLEEVDVEERTALIYAIEKGAEDAAILLVKGGARVDAPNKWGKTAKDLALDMGMNRLHGLMMLEDAKRVGGIKSLEEEEAEEESEKK